MQEEIEHEDPFAEEEEEPAEGASSSRNLVISFWKKALPGMAFLERPSPWCQIGLFLKSPVWQGSEVPNGAFS